MIKRYSSSGFEINEFNYRKSSDFLIMMELAVIYRGFRSKGNANFYRSDLFVLSNLTVFERQMLNCGGFKIFPEDSTWFLKSGIKFGVIADLSKRAEDLKLTDPLFFNSNRFLSLAKPDSRSFSRDRFTDSCDIMEEISVIERLCTAMFFDYSSFSAGYVKPGLHFSEYQKEIEHVPYFTDYAHYKKHMGKVIVQKYHVILYFINTKYDSTDRFHIFSFVGLVILEKKIFKDTRNQDLPSVELLEKADGNYAGLARLIREALDTRQKMPFLTFDLSSTFWNGDYGYFSADPEINKLIIKSLTAIIFPNFDDVSNNDNKI